MQLLLGGGWGFLLQGDQVFPSHGAGRCVAGALGAEARESAPSRHIPSEDPALCEEAGGEPRDSPTYHQ